MVRPGTMEAAFGTGGYLLQYSDGVPPNLKADVICGVHAIPGAYVLESSMLTCAALYDWGIKTFFPGEGLEGINAAAVSSPPGANGVTVLPYFQGRGTPDWNSGIRGGILNLSLSASRGDIARAILESIANEAQNNIDVLSEYIGESDVVTVGGGLTRERAFCQMLADVTGKAVLREQGQAEQTARGAWISAAVTLKLFPDYERAFIAATRRSESHRFEPNGVNYHLYREIRQRMNRYYREIS